MDVRRFLDSDFLVKFLRFCLVGFSGIFVDFGTTWLLKEVFKVQKYVSNATGFTLAATSNYFLNHFWTFGTADSRIFQEFWKFFVIATIGLGINTSIIWLLNGKLKVNFYISKLVATVIVTLWNFLINYFFTFS